ncbi:Lrp/AsnC family transcriptional regulator [Ornithinimicrobium pratense]|uniref:Lrp/AsnC family transcriptional regulator n=1 Tax=Ornithinimicrobium pratense TaxID=2593973 RepID=A0A5J6V7G8_9MICO|nr:Lrp/AsnC family transcriptional regulator [Ornithinimicrobium pratense]QFG69799.1 Lrp/AsnC family transcriptional regulator [Ornithinimicrobium pratense]
MPRSQTSSHGAPRAGSGRQVAALDDTDRQIVALLRADGRLSVRALAEQVHISRASAYTRLERLHRDGVITGYAAQVDPDRLGLATAAYVSVSIQQGSWREVRDALSELPGVERVALVGAEFDMLVQVRAHDNHELREVVLGQIQAIPGVRGTRTWLIFEEWVT